MTEPALPDILEAALLAAGRPLNLDDFAALFAETDCPDHDTLQRALAELANRFEQRPCELREVATGYRLQVKACYSPWLTHLFEERPGRYSRALMETLAIIAYRQPVTRGEIEEIRGVAVSSSITRTLQERAWIRVVGHKEVPGRPELLATTPDFLDHFNLKSLADLPPLQEFITQLELEKKPSSPHVDQTPTPSTHPNQQKNPPAPG